MSQVVALIQGASRGVGLQFCRSLLSRQSSVNVIATCRSPESADELQTLENSSSGRLNVLRVDVENESDIKVIIVY